MTDRIELLNYKGKEIFYSDFRDLSGEEYIQIIDKNIEKPHNTVFSEGLEVT